MNKQVPLLEIRDLCVTFTNRHETICAVSDFSCTVHHGTCTAIIGESGCGKSVAAHALLKLLPDEATITGSVCLNSVELLTLDEESLQKIRGRDIGIIYQSPDRSLNPIYRIGRQMREPITTHGIVKPENMWSHLCDTLRKTGFSNPVQAAHRYPCHCSGGMNQRAAAAIVLGLMPDLVIADEPTKGLDTDRVADVQAYLQEVTQEGRSLLLITHDIMLAQDIADELIVMYAGQVVECGPVQTVLTCPLHPYTRGLINSLPKHGFMPIEGYAPPLSNLPLGCRFAPRCRQASDRCHIHMPNIRRKNKQEVRCHQY